MLLDHAYPPDQRVENEAESLVKNGLEVTVLSLAEDDRPEIEMVNGVRVHRFKLSNKIIKKLRGAVGFFDIYSHLFYRYAKKAYARKPFDAVHAHDLYLVKAGIMIKDKFKVPLVADLHENYVEALSQYAWSTRPPGKWLISLERWKKLEKKWLEQSDRIISVIAEMKDRYTGMGFHEDKVLVIPNTPNIRAFREFPIKQDIITKYENRKILLYSGGFDLHRGLETAVRAMQTVKDEHPDALLLLVGDGRNRSELEALTDELALRDFVTFEGWQDQSNIRSYVKSATVGLIPHVRSVQTDASIPHKLGYYMSEELPVISSNCTSLERMVTEHDAGKIFESENDRDLANQINYLLSHPDEAKILAENGRRAVEKEFNWEATVEPLLSYYKSLASN
jgi:glycosyltransferase involved in cell wall biosynthesis